MFILLKVLLFFFRPLVWAIALFVWALLTKNAVRSKRLFISGVAVLLIFSNPLISYLAIKSYEAPPRSTAGAVYEAGVVLGGFISYSQQYNRGFFNPASDRFIQTALLYKNGTIKRIILAAGNGYWKENGFREANFAKQQFIQLGIPATAIYTDVASRNTEENAVYAKRIADSVHIPQPCLLITSAMHMPRAQYIFKKKGLTVVPFPCDFVATNRAGNFWEDYLLPSSSALRHWDFLLKEWLGYAVYRVK